MKTSTHSLKSARCWTDSGGHPVSLTICCRVSACDQSVLLQLWGHVGAAEGERLALQYLADFYQLFQWQKQTTIIHVRWPRLLDCDKLWRMLLCHVCATAQYNCCLPATTDCRRFCLFCTVPMQCVWHDIVTLISTLLLTYTGMELAASRHQKPSVAGVVQIQTGRLKTHLFTYSNWHWKNDTDTGGCDVCRQFAPPVGAMLRHIRNCRIYYYYQSIEQICIVPCVASKSEVGYVIIMDARSA